MSKRDTTLFYYQVLVESAQNILGVLSGLNRLYYSTFQFKRMTDFIEQMTIVPVNLKLRIENLFTNKLSIAAIQLEQLVLETVEIVEIQMPHVNTSLVIKELGARKQAWQLP